MKITKNIIMAFIEENFDEWEEIGDEIHVPSMFKLGADPSKHTNINTAKNGATHDYIAGEGWNFRTYVKMWKNFDNLQEVDEYLLKLAFKSLKNGKSVKELIEEQPIFTKTIEKPTLNATELPANFKPIIGNNSFGANRAKNYLLNRGLTEHNIQKFNLHYVPDGYYKDRIIIPFYEEGKMIWWQARSYGSEKRWLNPLNVKKEDVVFNIDNLKEFCILTEGVFDAMMIGGQAILGIELHDQQLEKLLKKQPKMIVVALDPDDAGYKNTEKVCKKLINAKYTDVFVTINNLGKDLDEVGEVRAWQMIRECTMPWGLPAKVKLMSILEGKKNREARCLNV